MAAPSRADLGKEIGLRSIELMLGDLSEVAEEWPEMPGAEQASWSLDWDQLMYGDLPELEQQYRAHELTADQQSRYVALLCRLRDALPTLTDVGLSTPPIILES